MKTANVKFFSVVDANSGYWQIELDETSSKLCTSNTPWGCSHYTSLPFRIKMAGDIFVQEMNKIVYDLPGVGVVTDEILIYGSTTNKHNEYLEALFTCAREANLKLNPKTSKIYQVEVSYVGQLLTGSQGQ